MFNFLKKRMPVLSGYNPEKDPFCVKALNDMKPLLVWLEAKNIHEAKKLLRESIINNLMKGARDDLASDANKILKFLEKNDLNKANKEAMTLFKLLDNEYGEMDD